MSARSKTTFLEQNKFSFEPLENSLSQDETPYTSSFIKQFSTQIHGFNFSDQNKAKLHEKKEAENHSMTLDGLEDETQVNLDKKELSKKTIKIHDEQKYSNKFSHFVFLLFILLSLIVVGTIILVQIEESLRRSPQSDNFRRGDKNTLYNLQITDQNIIQNLELSQQKSNSLNQKTISQSTQTAKKTQEKPSNDLNTHIISSTLKQSIQTINSVAGAQSCTSYIQKLQQKYGKLYTFNFPRYIFRSNSNVDHFIDQVSTKITQQKYVEAVDLLDVIHHIDSKGKIVSEDNPCENAESAIQRLNQTMQKQFQRLNESYQIDLYNRHQLRFCIVSNSYRNAQNGLLYRSIDSILQQNYTNYHVVYTDDASPDRTGEIAKEYLKEKKVGEDKFKVKINPQKKGMMENIFNAVTQDCQEGEIVVMLDGDDSFIGTNVLSLLNAVYQKEKVALMWNNFIQINENSKSTMGFSRNYVKEQQIIQSQRALRFVSSHLKSFYVDLFKKIKVEDLKQNNGRFFGGASDTAMMSAMIEMSIHRFLYLPEITYEYRYDTGQVGMVTNRAAQKVALAKISLTSPYQPLDDFSFVDEAISKAQEK